MADPLSLIASVFAVGTAALQCSRTLYDLIRDINDAPAQLTAIAHDCKAFENIVASLQSALKEIEVTSTLRDDVGLRRVVENLEEPICHCSSAVEKITLKLSKSYKITSVKKGQKSKMSDLRWAFSKKWLKESMANLGREKATLHLALDVVTNLIAFRIMQNRLPQLDAITPDPGQESPGENDVGRVLKQYAKSVSTKGSMYSEVDAAPLLRPGQPVDITRMLYQVEEQRAALHRAAEKGDDGEVRSLLEEGAFVDATNDVGNTALHVAAANGPGNVILTLLKHGANVSAKSYAEGTRLEIKFLGNRTALHWAAIRGHRYAIQCLLSSGADIAAFNASHRTPLQDAIMAGRTAAAKLLLEHGAPIDCVDDEGYTPLHEAANGGFVEIAEDLLDRGADIEAKCGPPTTADMERHSESTPAARLGSMPMTQLLISRGASVKATNSLGEMAIHEAASLGYPGIVRILLDGGNSTEERNPQRLNETPLHKAATAGRIDIVELLLQKGASGKTND